MAVITFQVPALAAEAPVYAPRPAWVQDIPVPAGKSSDDDAAVRTLLEDSQVYFGPDGDEYYLQTARQVLTADGLDQVGLVSQSWDPLLDTLTIHTVEIIRDGKAIDVLNEGEPFTIIRREQNLSYAMIDGRLTATKQLEGLMVGDIVRVTMTLTTKDPSLAGHTEFWDTLSHDGVIARVRYRQVWPKGRELRWRTTPGFPKAVLSQSALGAELLTDARDVRMPVAPSKAPDRFNMLGEIEITSFKSWRELSALFAPYYTQAAVLKEGSPIRAEAAKIREAHTTKAAQVSAALAVVEQRVRYVALVMGQAGYQPAAADLTWSRRFGDCKGKSALLIALLNELGIQAEPAIVRTHNSDGLDTRLPRAGLFDHVIVRVDVDGQTYWLDPTRSGDTDIKLLSVPSYLWALPLRAGGAELEAMKMVPARAPLTEMILDLDQTAGLEADTPVKVTATYRDETAADMLRAVLSMSRADAERKVREMWAKDLPWVTIEKVTVGLKLADDGSLSHVITGRSDTPWATPPGLRAKQVSLGDSVFKTEFEKHEKDATPNDAPYSLNFPYFNRSTVIIRLPRQGTGFEIIGADVDETIAGMKVRRISTLKDGVATITLDTETIAAETTYKEAMAAGDALNRLPTAKAVVVRAPRDFSMTGEEAEALLDDRPKDAQAFVLRGQTHLAAVRLTAALADFNQALKLAPNDPDALSGKADALVAVGDPEGALKALRPLIDDPEQATIGRLLRASIYEKYERYDEALADLDEAVKLSPNYAGSLQHRAYLHREMGHDDLARADVEAGLRLAPDDESMQRAKIWLAFPKDAPLQPWRDAMTAHVTRQIGEKPNDADLYMERAMLHFGSQKRDLARKDYDKGVELAPTAANYAQRAEFFDWVQDTPAALADYNRAVELEPKAVRYRDRAAFHAGLLNYSDARRDLEEAQRLEPDSLETEAWLAYLDIKQGDAGAGFARVDSLAKREPLAYDLREIKVTTYSAGKAYDLALAEANALAGRRGNSPDQNRQMKMIIADILSSQGEHAKSIEILNPMVRERPRSAQLLNFRCWVRATSNVDLTRAKADCDAALALASPADSAPYVDSLGLVHLQLGQYEEAKRAYDTVLAISGRYPSSLYGRAVAKSRLGDKAGSQADIAAALALDPEVATEFVGYKQTP